MSYTIHNIKLTNEKHLLYVLYYILKNTEISLM
jgi:hypothetical protein